MNKLVYPVFEFVDLSPTPVGAFMGVYSRPELAYEAACRAADSVTLFLGDMIFTADMLHDYLTSRQSNLVLTGENDLQVIIFYAPLDVDFIRGD